MSAHKRPEPLLDKAKLTAAASGLLSLLVTLGLIPATVGDQINGTLQACIAAGGLVATTLPVVVHAIAARGAVTPTLDPRNDDGQKLVPVGSAATLPAAAVVLAEADAIYPSAPPPPETPSA